MSVGQLLRSARNRRNLTLDMVFEKSGIGVSTLSEFENDKREPSLAQLKRLADVYERRTGYFLGEESEVAECVLWRHCPEPPVAQQLVDTLFDLADKYKFLEEVCNQQTVLGLPSVSESAEKLDARTAGVLANRVRRELGLGDRPARSLLRVLEETCNVRVFHLPFDPVGSAASTVSERHGAAVLLNSKEVRWKRNLDLAHELFHLLTWNVFGHQSSATIPQQQNEQEEREEQLADFFARNLLMPIEPFREAVEKQMVKERHLTIDGLLEVAREFDVSVEAVLKQVGNIFCVPQEEIHRALEQLKGRNDTTDVRESDSPPRRPERFAALARQAFRRGSLSTGTYADFVGISRREAMKLGTKETMGDVQIEIAHS